MSGPGTSTIVGWYAPACHDVAARYLDELRALDYLMHRHGYRPRAGVTGGYNCRNSTGSSTTKSTHSLGPGVPFTFWTGVKITTAGATDVNSDKNPYGPRLVTDMPFDMVREIEAVRTVSGAQAFRWGGRYTGNKDAMHYENIAPPHDLASGIDWQTVAGWTGGTTNQGDTVKLDEDDFARIQDMLNASTNNEESQLHKDIVATQALIVEFRSLLTDSSSGMLVQDHGVVSGKLRDIEAKIDAIVAKVGA